MISRFHCVVSRCVGLAVLFAAAVPVAALDFAARGGTYSSARHDRFVPGTFPTSPVPNPTFFLAAHESELAALGWQTNDVQKKAALISPQHFLNANHYLLSGTITFLNQDGVLKTYTIQSNTQVMGTDIAIGRLATPIPTADHIPYFTVVDTDPAPWFGREAVYFGRGPNNTNCAAGRTVPASSSLETYVFYDASQVAPESAVDRCNGVTGDSGSPTFVEQGGVLALMGHHVSPTGDGFLGFYRDAVDDSLLAPSGYLMRVANEWQLGDPKTGGLVVSRLPRAGSGELLDFGTVSGINVSRSVRFMLYNFSAGSRTVTLQSSQAGFAPVNASTLVGGNGARVPAEVVFTPFAYGAVSGTLLVSDGVSSFTIPMVGSAVDLGMVTPSLYLSPSSQSGEPQQTRSYSFSIANNDLTTNPATTFQLSATPPAGSTWTASVSPTSLSLAPGATGSATVAVTSPPLSAAIPAGSYSFFLSVTDSQAQPVHAASVSGQYTLVLPAADTTPPSAPTSLTASGNRTRTTLNWSASGDNVGVTQYQVWRNGAALATNTTTRYVDSAVQANVTYTYSVRARDAAGNWSAQSAAIRVKNGRVVP